MLNFENNFQVDGFAKIGFNEDGTKGIILSLEANDVNIQTILEEEITSDVESVFSLEEIRNKTNDLSNRMVLITFSYSSKDVKIGLETEWENVTTVEDVLTLSKNFKELWENNINAMYHYTLNDEVFNSLPEVVAFDTFFSEK